MLATREAEPSQRLCDLRAPRPDTSERACDLQVLGRGQVILDRIGVPDVDELTAEFLLQPPDVFTAPAYLAAGRFEQAACNAQEAGLPGTVGSPDPEQIAAVQCEVQRAEEPALPARTMKIDRLEG